MLWLSKWQERLEILQLENIELPQGDPLRVATLAQLMGTGEFREGARQAFAGIDLAVAESTIIKDSNVHILKSTVSGPLGHGLSALLIGRSSASKMGIFVLPGCIDADYTGNIGIMVKCFLPPVTIPFGSRIAQLIPFRSCVPNIGQNTRKDGGFGSTGNWFKSS
uniref:dUTPase-like domain-containing protein n=1 Tax=Malurus cyaneus samueli TaxID=2593467 RepID=A0A8C5X1Z5_9PASS